MVNVLEDVATLTTINEQYIQKLTDIFVYCINDAVERAVNSRESVVDLDIGIGILSINIDNNSIRYKFRPGDKLEKSVANTVITETNELSLLLEKSLVEKLSSTYKNFL